MKYCYEFNDVIKIKTIIWKKFKFNKKFIFYYFIKFFFKFN